MRRLFGRRGSLPRLWASSWLWEVVFCFFSRRFAAQGRRCREGELVLAFIGLANNLVDVIDRFLLLQLVVWVDTCVSEVVCGPVGRVDHVGCSSG